LSRMKLCEMSMSFYLNACIQLGLICHASIEETMDTYGHLFPNAKHQLSSMLDSYAKRHADAVPLSLAN
jgi:hypothetical protein